MNTTDEPKLLTGEPALDQFGKTYFKIALTGRDGTGRFALVDGVGMRKLREYGARALYIVNDGRGREYVTMVTPWHSQSHRRYRAVTAARVVCEDPKGARIEFVSGDRLDLRRSNLRVRRYAGVGEARAAEAKSQ